MTRICLALASLALGTQVLFAIDTMSSGHSRVMTFGGKEGWGRVAKKDGVAEGKGRFGYHAMMLSSNSRQADGKTDMLLNFEQKPFIDNAYRYTVVTSDMLLSSSGVAMGKGAALCRGESVKGMLIRGNKDSLFGTEGPTGSFYIEFYLKPAVAENGEVVLSWRSSRKAIYTSGNSAPQSAEDRPVQDNLRYAIYSGTASGSVVYQMISCSFLNNHLVWDLTNMFDLPVGYGAAVALPDRENDVSVRGIKNIVPGTWSHHALVYDSESGCLEYRVDGVLEDIKYITDTGHEGGTVMPMYLGVSADIELCPHYTGMIDDFRIERGTKAHDIALASENATSVGYTRYNTSAGRFETEPLLVAPASSMDSLVSLMTVPSQTEVRLYVRCGDNFYNWTDTYPAWRSVNSGEKIKGMSGMYFQVAADLMSDGRGDVTPSVTELQLHYTEPGAPLPPFGVRAVAGDGSVKLEWSYSVDEAAGEYFVYYGTRPGEYLCRVALEGASPINAGKTNTLTLNGLNNGTIYYFAVSAASKYDDRIQGVLSKEVYARPRK